MTVATITAHHLYLTVSNKEDPFAFCKPIPKNPSDRDALLKAVIGGEEKFFLYVFPSSSFAMLDWAAGLTPPVEVIAPRIF